MNAWGRRSIGALAIAALAAGVAACTPAVALQPAADAASPLCAEVSVRLPPDIDDLPKRETTAQATAAWGLPTAVVLHCGVESPAPTSTLQCYTVDGVDWLVDDANDPEFRFTSYGRTPAVTVAIDNTVVAGISVLEAIAPAVGRLPVTGACLALDEVGK